MNKKLKVLLTTNIPSPYMVDYLDALGQYCDLTALFEMQAAKDRMDQWYGRVNGKRFRSIFLKSIPFSAESGLSFQILRHLRGDYDRIIIANPTTPTGILALLYCRAKKIPFLLQSEGGFRGSGKGPKEKFKKFLMEKASLYLSGMQGEDEYFLSYGATAQTLRPYPFTSLKQAQIDQVLLSPAEKQALRRELGIPESQVVISVGRAIPVKGFDVLLKAKQALPQGTGLYIVGCEATGEYRQLIRDYDLQNVHFISHCSYDTLCKYYHAADVFALATRGDTWGLVINEAMACGLPVVTTDRCVAGLQLIENDKNGYIVPVDDADALSQRIHQLLLDDALRLQMAENNLKKIQPYSIENMAQTIFEALQS